MTEAQMLTMLKVDLGITAKNYDERLLQYIETAKTEIVRQGARLDMSVTDHCTVVIMYAEWMWRKRESGEGMPRMVRYAVNNLVLSQKMAAEEETQ